MTNQSRWYVVWFIDGNGIKQWVNVPAYTSNQARAYIQKKYPHVKVVGVNIKRK